MANQDFWSNVTERAYFKYLNRIISGIQGSPEKDWEEALIEQAIEEKIREEAFLHSLSNNLPPEINWKDAKQEIEDRIKFLAFYRHETIYNANPEDNWVEAQRLYLHKFAA